MQRRAFVGGAALVAAVAGLGLALAEDPIVFGLITPLSPPGETALGQLAKRGAEIGVEYINEKGGVLGRGVRLSVHDSAGKNEQGVAAYRRLVSSEKAVAVFGFIHSGVNIAVNEVAKEMSVPTIGTQTGAGDVTAKHYDIALRAHAVDGPRAAAWLGWIAKNTCQRVSLLAETTHYAFGLAKETESQSDAQTRGLELQSIMFDRTTTDLVPPLLQAKAFKPDAIVNVGVGQPLDLMITHAHTVGLLPGAQMVTSYDGPARPQFWQLHGDQGVGMNFIAFYSPKSELSDLGKEFAKRYEAKFNEPPVYAALNGFANAIVFAEAIKKANSIEPKAMIKALEEGSFIGWSTTPLTFPRAEGPLWHNWSPPLMVLHYTAKDQTPATAEVAYVLGQ